MEGHSTLNHASDHEPTSVTYRPVTKYVEHEECSELKDAVAIEAPLEIRLNGKAWMVTMRSPGFDHDLASGFLWSEKIIHHVSDILEIAHCERGEAVESNILNVFLRPGLPAEDQIDRRRGISHGGCGLCGKTAMESIQKQFPPILSEEGVDAPTICSLLDSMHSLQNAFMKTGGVHAAALFDAHGQCLVLREDIGRHNAVDKVIGHHIRNSATHGRPPAVLAVSSRASFEIVQKSISLGVPIIACASAPSSLAVDLAQAFNQTLVGFLREGRFNVYTHPSRILTRPLK